MKKLAVLLFIAGTITSCSKDSSGSDKPPKPDVTGFPVSYTLYVPGEHRLITHKFIYDANHNLASVSLQQNDTATTSVVLIDSGSFYFTVDPATSLPASYTAVYKTASQPAAQTETHSLFYNAGTQLIKDSGTSVVSGPNTYAPTKYYTYSGNFIIRDVYLDHVASARDTIFMSNANIGYQLEYFYNGNTWVFSSLYNPSYSAYTNPFYNVGVSNSLGAFLSLELMNDFLSRQLANIDGYSWTLNSAGKVISGQDGSGGYVTFTY